jgi:PAS domain-containing protein
MTNEHSAAPSAIDLPFRLKERLLETLADTAGIGIVLVSGCANLLYVNSVARALWCPKGISPTMSCAADLWRQILSRAEDPENLLEDVKNTGMQPEDTGEFRFTTSDGRSIVVQTAPCDTGDGYLGRLWTFRETECRAQGPSSNAAEVAESLASIVQLSVLAGRCSEWTSQAERYRIDVQRSAQRALELIQRISSDKDLGRRKERQ